MAITIRNRVALGAPLLALWLMLPAMSAAAQDAVVVAPLPAAGDQPPAELLLEPAPQPIVPEAIRAMIAVAARSDDPAVFTAVVSIAKQSAPHVAGLIDTLATYYAKQAAAARSPIVQPAPPPALPPFTALALAPPPEPPPPVWKGAVEFGGSNVSGVTDSLGVYGALDISRTTPVWVHRLTAKADYQKTDGIVSAERFLAAYQPQARVTESIYGFGLAQYEHDLIAGYRHRYTIGAGVGVKAIDRANLQLSLDAGPALRHTNFYDEPQDYALAGRGSLNLKWLPSSRITVIQDAAVYVEGGQATAKSSTALETLLFGPLKGRLSYNVQYERDRRKQQSDTNTTTRATLIYNF